MIAMASAAARIQMVAAITRDSARGIDCERGHYERDIAIMEDLLRRKAFDVPPPAPPSFLPPIESPEYGV
jgi:hypothetical protein